MLQLKQYKLPAIRILLIVTTIINVFYHKQKLDNIYNKIDEKLALNNINTALITKKITDILSTKELHQTLDLSFENIKYDYINKNTMSVIITSQNLYLDLEKLTALLNNIQQKVKAVKINTINKEIIITIGGIK